jgi:hypothetical protein
MVDYYKLPVNRELPDPEQNEEDQEVTEPQVDVVVNTYHENGGAKSFAVKVSIRLPVKS